MDDVQRVRRRCVFTTHTPVPSGHDHFPEDLVQDVLGAQRGRLLDLLRCCVDGHLNMTYLALFFSHFINGVSMRHEEISKGMFPSYPINAITNGVHTVTWTSPPFRRLFDLHVPEWRHDNRYLRYVIGIAPQEILQTHAQAKRDLFALIMERTEIVLDPKVMTLGFARRAARYKRAGLLFADLDRLRRIARDVGPLQIVLGGKAHPRDEGGKALIREIHQAAASLDDAIRIVYLENYDMTLGLPLTAGVDLWINTPQKPFEASGTSGMKAALNGVPSLSILDGWWIEGHIEGVTGWSIDDAWQTESDSAQESERLYDKLEYLIVPMYYGRPTAYARVMRSAIALNGSFFNARRMLDQYVQNAYLAAMER
jgi:starch phosphorylase